MGGKIKTAYICSECGYESPKWSGKCPNCNAWNTLEEEIIASAQKAGTPVSLRGVRVEKIAEIQVDREYRYKTGISELDRVLGGGLVKGSVVLLSGDPGIGKSTLLMQLCHHLKDRRILYVSGEESAGQLKLRAARLGVQSENLLIMTETDVAGICEFIKTNRPEIVLIDSIQTMNLDELTSSSGTVTQVRECTAFIQRTCKSIDVPVILVGHVNKDGAVAGPKVMEHIVDAVLYFEGERNHSYRILRAIKNRYGSTNEIGVFEMNDTGLTPVENPSSFLLSERSAEVSGSCISCVMEGTRPLLAEIQSLVTATGYGNARRMATGFDYNRMNLLLAVLEKRVGLVFANFDVYINVVGGLKLDEPACDLSVALSLVSGVKDRPLPADLVAFGEVGLSGEIRSVSRVESRIKEAGRLGFKQCMIPYSCLHKVDKSVFSGMELIGVHSLKEAIYHLF
ncbi:MAG: DNA repair protein RadA [Clostridia bacterium]|nr:DNA repair protein RadA [Clostridia bacterium]